LPQVFTYLDEGSALMEEGQWRDGRLITYEEYLKLINDAQDQTARQAIEIQKWRSAMQIISDQDDNAALKCII
jgi:uncharacterized protein YeaC (DUF1315 family)